MKNLFSRVDRQASILIGIILMFTILIFGTIFIAVGYEMTVNGLEKRIENICEYADENLNLQEDGMIYTKAQMNSTRYRMLRAELQNIRMISDFRYLYTATRNPEGELIYMIDGLPLDEKGVPLDKEDYRYPGDLIEPEIQEQVARALDGEVVKTDFVGNTSWGDVIVAYYPLHDETGKVVAVLGLEYSPDDETEALIRMIKQLILIGIILCIITTFISIRIFKRISNPMYKDLSNTDYMTKLKNRNALEIDFTNIMEQKVYKDLTLFVIDLNDLKKCNDEYGHDVGDRYIALVGQALGKLESRTTSVYRYGGDEFIIVSRKPENVDVFLADIDAKFKETVVQLPLEVSYAIGYATFDAEQDTSIYDTQKRADEQMYQDKKKKKTYSLDISRK